MKYGVIYSETHYTPGDERSRTNPGHGYPESWDTVEKFQSFKDKEDMERWVKSHYVPKSSWDKSEQKFKIIEYNDLALEVKVETIVKIS